MGCGSIAEVSSVPDGSLGKVSSCGSIANGLLALGLFLAECVTASGGSDVNDFTQRNADMFFHRNYFDLYVLLTVLRLVWPLHSNICTVISSINIFSKWKMYSVKSDPLTLPIPNITWRFSSFLRASALVKLWLTVRVRTPSPLKVSLQKLRRHSQIPFLDKALF